MSSRETDMGREVKESFVLGRSWEAQIATLAALTVAQNHIFDSS